MKSKALYLSWVVWLVAVAAMAQSRPRYGLQRVHTADVQTGMVHAYTDSLNMLRDRIYGQGGVYGAEASADSASLAGMKVQPDVLTAPLLLPPTFYRHAADGMFIIPSARQDSTQHWNRVGREWMSQALMNLYLSRPDLVRYPASRLTAGAAGLGTEPLSPIKHETQLTDKVAPEPLEPTQAPVDIFVTKPNFWTLKGDYNLQFMQNYVSGNWYKGGESNYSALGTVTMEANYNNKQKVKWDNKLEMRFGLQSTRSDSLHSFKTTEDLLRLTSKYGLQSFRKWYYTAQLIATTQFMHAYKANNPQVYSAFLAPLTINLSLGMDYNVDWVKHKLKGTIHLAPIAYNWKYTRLRELAKRLGIDEGKRSLNDYGSEFTVDLTWTFNDMLAWKTRLYGYTTYDRTEFEWENTFTLKFNRYISAQLFIYPRYDDGVERDGHHGYFQYKEYASIGFSYSF